MACVIAGTKKTKEEPSTKSKNTADTQPARPAPQNNNNISLQGAKAGKSDRQKKKCEC